MYETQFHKKKLLAKSEVKFAVNIYDEDKYVWNPSPKSRHNLILMSTLRTRVEPRHVVTRLTSLPLPRLGGGAPR